MKTKIDIINILLLIITGFSIYFQLYPPKNTQGSLQSLLFFLGTFIYIIVIYVIGAIIRRAKAYLLQIQKNTQAVKELKETMQFHQQFEKLKGRISSMEPFLNRKGEIDLRWVMLGGAFVLFYLYIRSLGLVP